MKTKKLSETYLITRKDETGLIPEKTAAVIVNYDENGKQSIFYNAKYNGDFNGQSKKIERLNLLRPTTQKGIEKVVEFFKIFSQ